MAKRLQLRGGTTSQHSTFTGAVREVTVDTDKDTLVVHDGSTAGGKALPTLTGTETLTNKTLTAPTITGTTTITDEIHINSTASGSTLHTLLKLETDGTADGSGITIDTRTAHTRGEINFLDGTGSYDSNYVFKTATGSLLAAPTEKFRVTPTGATVTGDLTVDTDTLYVDSTNNRVGIGTTSPNVELEISGASEMLRLQSTDTNKAWVAGYGSGTSARWLLGSNASNDSVTLQASNSTGELLFKTGGANERMRIASDGNVGIGTTGITGFKVGIDAQGDGIGALKMYSNVAGRPTIEIVNTNSTDYAQSILWLQSERTTTNGSYNFMRLIQTGVTDKFFIRDSGNTVNANNSYGAISDLKLKEQITDASSQSTDIKNIRIRKFKFKHEVAEGDSDSLWKLGVIAQEIEAVSPGLVETVKDTDKEGNAILDDEGNESYTKNVKYSVLYMKAVKALQEVLVEIDTLKARITTLENN